MNKFISGLMLLMILPLISETRYITDLTDATFQKEVLESEEAVLVDFWAPWCGPCRTLGPVIEQIAEENHLEMKFAKLNVDDHKQVAGAYGISSIPTVGIFVHGKPVDGFVGLRNKEEILDILKKHFRSAQKEETPVKN